MPIDLMYPLHYHSIDCRLGLTHHVTIMSFVPSCRIASQSGRGAAGQEQHSKKAFCFFRANGTVIKKGTALCHHLVFFVIINKRNSTEPRLSTIPVRKG